MRVTAFVANPDAARAILDHLGLPSDAPVQAAARGPPQAAFEGWDQSVVD